MHHTADEMDGDSLHANLPQLVEMNTPTSLGVDEAWHLRDSDPLFMRNGRAIARIPRKDTGHDPGDKQP